MSIEKTANSSLWLRGGGIRLQRMTEGIVSPWLGRTNGLFKPQRKRGLFLFVVLFLITISSAEAQCSMCRAVLESEADGKTAEGINNGIVYLMAIPYLIVGGLFYIIYRKIKG
jgi:hypothetical protein